MALCEILSKKKLCKHNKKDLTTFFGLVLCRDKDTF